ncbi:MAG TPA: site-2 protease family protein [Myxococcales bacterium]|jgi:Zn-dependent protease/CBS domain-containing protein
MRGTIRIGTLRGIPIRVHFTLLLVLPFLAFLFGRAFVGAALLAEVPPGQLHGSPWLWGLGVAVALFVSVLVHELAHALYALSKGVEVRDITLLMIGGVSQIAGPPKRSRDEAVMALVGPLSSLVIGAAFFGLFRLAHGVQAFDLRFALFYVAQLNLVLGLFNLVPAFPMDGGRVLRAALVGRLGFVRATRVAAAAGKVFAVLFGLLGLFSFNFLLLLVALFVYLGAEGESRQVLIQATLGHVKVRDFMSAGAVSVETSAPVSAAAETMVRERRLALPVVDHEQARGVVTLEDVQGVPPEQRSRTLVGQVAHRVQSVRPDDEVWQAIRLMDAQGTPQLPVVEDDARIVGTITQGDVARGIRLEELAVATARTRAERPPTSVTGPGGEPPR